MRISRIESLPLMLSQTKHNEVLERYALIMPKQVKDQKNRLSLLVS